MTDLPLTRDLPCGACGHDHLWLDCDWCPCTTHEQTGIYPKE